MEGNILFRIGNRGIILTLLFLPGSEHYEDGEYGDYESVGTPMVGARFSYLLKKRLDSVRYNTRPS